MCLCTDVRAWALNSPYSPVDPETSSSKIIIFFPFFWVRLIKYKYFPTSARRHNFAQTNISNTRFEHIFQAPTKLKYFRQFYFCIPPLAHFLFFHDALFLLRFLFPSDGMCVCAQCAQCAGARRSQRKILRFRVINIIR